MVKAPKLPALSKKAPAEEFSAADEALQGTQVPEVSPRVKANKSAMARLLSRG